MILYAVEDDEEMSVVSYFTGNGIGAMQKMKTAGGKTMYMIYLLDGLVIDSLEEERNEIQ